MEQLTYLFDPRSPWSAETSRWLRRLEELGELEIAWSVFSLEIVNLREGDDPHGLDAEYGPPLRTALVLRGTEGMAAIAGFFAALMEIMWFKPVPPEYLRDGPPPRPMEIVTREALALTGHDPELLDEVMADPATWEAVITESARWRDEQHVIGVPTIIWNGGAGPMSFGPVFDEMPDDETCLEIWRHVSWLVHYGTFFEWKQHDARPPWRNDLPNFGQRWWRAGWDPKSPPRTYSPSPTTRLVEARRGRDRTPK